MIAKACVGNAVYGHIEVVCCVDLIGEYLSAVEDCVVLVILEVAPDEEPVSQRVVSIFIRLNVDHASGIVSVKRMSATSATRESVVCNADVRSIDSDC